MLTTGILLPDLGLPLLTGSRARPAKTHGAFGLVGGWLTNAYHPADLGRNLPFETFTKHYHRGQGDSQLI